MGGSKERDVPSNIIVMCSRINYLMEADAAWAEQARAKGWKLVSGQDPSNTPFWHYQRGWTYLDDAYNVKGQL